MRWQRIKTMMLHSWFHLSHSVETWVDLFYSSTIAVIVFGLMTQYMTQGEDEGVILMGLILWNVLWVSQYSVSVGMMWEVWAKNFSSLFITPLTMTEFIAGQALAAGAKAVLVFGLMSSLSWVAYGFNIGRLGWWLGVYILQLWLTGMGVAMIVNGLILRFGRNIQSLTWSLVYLLQPVGAIFFPVVVLPQLVQHVSWALPLTYVFEAARAQLGVGSVVPNWWVVATLLNVILVGLSYGWLKLMLRWAKDAGAFARMEQ